MTEAKKELRKAKRRMRHEMEARVKPIVNRRLGLMFTAKQLRSTRRTFIDRSFSAMRQMQHGASTRSIGN